MKQASDLYQSVTDAIIEALENGCPPWQKSWSGSSAGFLPMNLKTGARYNGINILIFWMKAELRGYASPYWLTFKQARELGGCVRKGEKGTTGLFFRTIEKTDTVTGEVETIPMPRRFTAFNIDQVEGIERPDHNPEINPDVSSDDVAEAFVAATGANIERADGTPCFIPSRDIVRCPPRMNFRSNGDYYATMFHELTHWSGGKSRLNRELGKRFGDSAYAAEELVAELGAAFLCADLGIDGQVQEHASYIDHWIEMLSDDPSALTKAASLASAAHNYLKELTSGEAQTSRAA